MSMMQMGFLGGAVLAIALSACLVEPAEDVGAVEQDIAIAAGGAGGNGGVICDAECKTVEKYKWEVGCKGLTGAPLRTCLEALCDQAKAAHAADPTMQQDCPQENGPCSSPLEPDEIGTCTFARKFTFSDKINGCSWDQWSSGEYAVYYGSFCKYECRHPGGEDAECSDTFALSAGLGSGHECTAADVDTIAD